MSHFDRIVIGAGISGLLAAWRAVKRGETVLILEREARAGGVLTPISLIEAQADPVVIDAGAESFSIAGNSLERLIQELELGQLIESPQRSDARIIHSDNERYRIPHGVLGIPVSLEDPELEAIISPQGLALAKHLDSLPVQDLAGFTVAQVVENRLGPEFVQKLVNPVVSGVHGSGAQLLDASATLPQLMKNLSETNSLTAAAAKTRGAQPRPGAAVAGLSGGMFQLADRLVSLLL
ncbi:MAG: protoporphyrinogen/coproporphyrinogen oxidase, partial [Micrococcales bacterium]